MAALALVTAACASEAPDLTEVVVGPEGGLVTSRDGVLSLVFQPGALTREQTIQIFPSDEPPLVFGPAYRVKPDIDLMIDVEVGYQRALPNDTSAVAVSAIRLEDYSNEEGHWVALPRLSLHEDQNLVRAYDSQLSLYYGMIDSGGGSVTTSSVDNGNSQGATDDNGVTGDPTGDDMGDTDGATTDPTDTDATDTETVDPGCSDGNVDEGELCFNATDFPISGGPVDVTIGDFDNDGSLDLATANGDGTFSVRLGDGSGGFASELNVAAGNGPAGIDAGDLDQAMGDDLVIALSGSNQMLLLQSQGNGSFGENLIALSGMTPTEVLVDDFTDDGIPDIVITNAGSGNISYFTFNAGLGAEALYDTGPVGAPVGLSRGQYNFTGNQDVDAFAYGGGNYAVMPGNGMGLSNSPLNGALGTDLRRAVGGDLGGTDAGDAAVADFGMGGVHVLIGDGQPNSFSAMNFYPTGTGTVDVAVGDFNGDGDIDIVAANSGNDNVTLLSKTGGSAWDESNDYDVGSEPSGVRAGDFNGDGVDDIVVSNQAGNSVTVLISDP